MEKEGQLDYLFKKVYSVLKQKRTPYLLIGGLAAGILGRPRFTQNIDFLIFISRDNLNLLLESIIEEGIEFDREKVEKSILAKGVFRVYSGDYHADFIINSLDVGENALKRAIEIKLFNENVKIPSPEDLILFKLIAGRDLDFIDAKNVYLRHGNKLDKDYLVKWAQKICDETENMGVWKRLKNLMEI